MKRKLLAALLFAAAVLLVLCAGAPAEEIPLVTVTLSAGNHMFGGPVSFTSRDEGRLADSAGEAEKGQFYWDNGDFRFKIPDCPVEIRPIVPDWPFSHWHDSANKWYWPGETVNVSGISRLNWEADAAQVMTLEPLPSAYGYWSDCYVDGIMLNWEIVVYKDVYNRGIHPGTFYFKDIRGQVVDSSAVVSDFVRKSGRDYVLRGQVGFDSGDTISVGWIGEGDVVTVSDDGNGYGYATPPGGDRRSNVTLTAVPNEGYVFDRWELVSGSARLSGNTLRILSAGVEVKAHFKPGTFLNITFHPGAGTVSPAAMVTMGDGRLASLPVPEREGWHFGGWYTLADGGEKVTENTVFEEAATVYASWYQDSSYTLETPERVALAPGTAWTEVPVSISALAMNPNETKTSPDCLRVVVEGGKLVHSENSSAVIPFKMDILANNLQYPSNMRYLDFSETGTQSFYINIRSDDWDSAVPGVYAGSVSYYTMWCWPDGWYSAKTGYGVIPLTVTIGNGPQNVTVAVSPAEGGTAAGAGTYEAGAEVTLSAVPAAGYRFREWQFSPGTVEVSGGTFAMPASDVVATAVFERIPYEIECYDGVVASVYDGWLGRDVDEAPAGELVSLRLTEDVQPKPGNYYTGEFEVNGESLGLEYDEAHGYSWPVEEFTMPAGAVTVHARQEKREALALNFSLGSTQVIPLKALAQLRNDDGNMEMGMFTRDEDDHGFIDLDGSGIPDLAFTETGTEVNITLALLPDADAAGAFSFNFSYMDDRYSPISIYLPCEFGSADFILSGVAAIEANAFEGDPYVTVVDARGCASVGAEAFRNCLGLKRIRLPKNCTIDSTAFRGCGRVFVFAPSGGSTQAWCAGRENIVFIPEAQN